MVLQGVSPSNPLTCQWLFPCSFRMLKKEIPRQCDLFIELLSSLYSTSHLCGHHPHDLWNCASLLCSQSAGDFRWSIGPFPRVFPKRRTGARADYPHEMMGQSARAPVLLFWKMRGKGPMDQRKSPADCERRSDAQFCKL